MLRIRTNISQRGTLQNWMSPPPYVMNEELRWPQANRLLFGDRSPTGERSAQPGPEEESRLFKQLHYCGYRLRRLYKAAHRYGPNSFIERRYRQWMQRYQQVRSRLVERNLGLAYSAIRHSHFSDLDPDELCSEATMALLRATDTFDPWRGFRFSTYAHSAITRAFSRSALCESRRRRKIAGSLDGDFDEGRIPAAGWTDQAALFAERLQQILEKEDSPLTETEKKVLARRFPLQEGKRRQTLEGIGEQLSLSKERVRQIQLSAIAKLRGILAKDMVLQ
jgi:RNA polymerase primary sigma factor